MIYILEGVNKVGKSTLRDKICNNTGIQFLDLRRPLLENEAIVVGTTISTVLNTFRYTMPSAIMDRSFISEIVYKNIDFSIYKEIDEKFSRFAKILYLSLPDEIVLSRWNELKFKSDITLNELKKRYVGILQLTKIPIEVINPLDEIDYENFI